MDLKNKRPAKDRLTPAEFTAFLQDLADSGVVRVTGSYAAGTQNTGDHVSDLDFYVLRGSDGIRTVVGIFERHGVKWDSGVVGELHSPRDLYHLPMPVECSYLFDCNTHRLFDLKIFGVKFKAYRQ